MTPTKASVVVFTEFQSIQLMLWLFWFQDAGNKDIQTVQALTLTSLYINWCDNCKAIGQLEANNAATIKNRDVADCGCNKTAWKCLILVQPQDDRSEKKEASNTCSLSNHGTRAGNHIAKYKNLTGKSTPVLSWDSLRGGTLDFMQAHLQITLTGSSSCDHSAGT